METTTRQRSGRTVKPATKKSASSWISIKQGTIVRCGGCAYHTRVENNMILHAESLYEHRWHITCRCGTIFSIADLLAAGAVLQSGKRAFAAMRTN